MRIWFDTEFIDTGSVIHLLSIGMIREDGEIYYAEPEETDRTLAGDWVKTNVLPHLRGPVKPRRQIREEIAAFCGPRPEFWAYYAAYDWVLLCQLFGRMMDVPAHWPKHVMDLQQLRLVIGVPKLPQQTTTQHHALNDALWNRDAWKYVMNIAAARRVQK